MIAIVTFSPQSPFGVSRYSASINRFQPAAPDGWNSPTRTRVSFTDAAEMMMADQFPKDRKAEAGTAGEAREAAEKPPREDRDRYQGFSIEQVRKDNAAAAADPPAATDKP